MNRNHEIIDIRVVIGITLSLVGAIALTVNATFVVFLLPKNVADLVTAPRP